MPPAGPHSNSFDALRLLAALAVVVGHAYVLTGILGQTPFVLGIAVHGMGVAAFFVISGFLVTDSWLRTPQPSVYVANRALRILPGLAFVVVATIVVLGPVFTTSPIGDYVTSPVTWKYAANLLPLLPQYDLPGVFEHLPFPDAVNGSLWTLRAEIACYIVVVIIGLLPRVTRLPLMLVFGGVAVAIALGHVTIAGSSLSAAATTWVYFAAASAIRLLADLLPARRVVRVEIAAIVLAVWIVLATFTSIEPEVLAWLALPYVLLAVGQLSIPGVRRAARFGDMSYGMYLWAFPVQQALLQLGLRVPVLLDIVIVAVISGAFAMLSWHVVESPALRLKKRVRAAADARRARRDQPSLA